MNAAMYWVIASCDFVLLQTTMGEAGKAGLGKSDVPHVYGLGSVFSAAIVYNGENLYIFIIKDKLNNLMFILVFIL